MSHKDFFEYLTHLDSQSLYGVLHLPIFSPDRVRHFSGKNGVRYVDYMRTDEEQGKYFKIQPNHLAPKGARYSTSGVKRENEAKKKRKRDSEFKARLTQSRIRRSGILHNALGGPIALNREIGSQTTGRLCGPSALWAARSFKSSSIVPEYWFSEANAIRSIGFVVRDGASGLVFAGGRTRNGHCAVTTCTAQIGSEGPRKASEGSIDLCAHEYPSEGTVRLSASADRDLTFFHSSPSPSAQSTIAIATSHGVTLLVPRDDGYLRNFVHVVYHTTSNVLACAWLSSTVLAGGCRDGAVRLYDARSRGEAKRLQHPSAVCHLRRADEYRVVAAGLENSLQTYDLRFSRSPSSSKSTLTTPYITYPSYINPHHPSLAFDVSPSLGLVAAATPPPLASPSAATEGDQQSTSLFDLWTGRVVEGWTGLGKGNLDIGCIAFTNNEHGDDEALVGVGDTVELWR
ncbi:hypothetical protein MMC20_005766 [Loxospora ochrophaea]|nr:hypothetical protein [Loxospora ochrophaea]